MALRLIALALVGIWVAPIIAAPPVVHGIVPSALIPGRENVVQLLGENLDGPAELWTSFPCSGTLEREDASTPFRLKVPLQTNKGYGAIRVVTTNGISGLVFVAFDAISTLPGTGTNRSIATAQLIPRDHAVDGFCPDLGSAFYRIAAKKGETFRLEVVAQRIGSPLDPLFRVIDEQGRELASADDSPGLNADAALDFRAPRAGSYVIEVRDTRYAGGPRHRFRLRLATPLPVPLPFVGQEIPSLRAENSLPTITEHESSRDEAQPIAIPAELHGRFSQPDDVDWFEFHADKGQRLRFTGRTRSLGSPCDLFFRIESTNGTKVAQANVTGGDEGTLTNKFANAGNYRLIVEELNHQGGPRFDYRLAIEPVGPTFRLSTEVERLSLPAGSSFEVEVQAERQDFSGPIQLELVGLEGFSVTNNVIPGGTNTVTKLKLTAPGDATLGDFHEFRIVGRAKIGTNDFTTLVSTRPALKAQFPEMRFPPDELDGLLMLSISESKSSSPTVRRKRRN